MTEIVVGVLLALAFPQAIAAIRRAWEAAAPAPAKEQQKALEPADIIEAIRDLPAEPAILEALARALQDLRARIEPPAPSKK